MHWLNHYFLPHVKKTIQNVKRCTPEEPKNQMHLTLFYALKCSTTLSKFFEIQNEKSI